MVEIIHVISATFIFLQGSRGSKDKLFIQNLVNLISALGVCKVDLVMMELPVKCFGGGGDGYDEALDTE